MKRVVVVGVDHVYEFYRRNEGPRKRHRRFGEYLRTLHAQSPKRIAIVIEEGGPGLLKAGDVRSGVEGSVPRDFAENAGARFRFADLPLDDCRTLLGGRHPREVPGEERSVLYPEREKAIGEAVVTEARELNEDEQIVVVLGENHMKNVAASLGEEFEIIQMNTLPFGWQNVDPFDPDE